MQTESHVLTLGPNGRLMLPTKLRDQIDLLPGDRVMVQVGEDKKLQLTKLQQQLAEAEGLYRSLISRDKSVVEELLAERRQEAVKE